MQYPNPGPMFFGPPVKAKPARLISVRGGRAAAIPKQDRCPSGRHNKRLTQCFCRAMKRS